MLPCSATLPPAADVARAAERMKEAAARRQALATWWHRARMLGDADGQGLLGAADHLGVAAAHDPVAALAWLTRPRIARSQLADRFDRAARDGCTADACAEAERRARLPLGGRAEGT